MTKAAAWISLYVRDVRECPEVYDAATRANPQNAAKIIIDGLTDAEIVRMTNELRRERARYKKGKG